MSSIRLKHFSFRFAEQVLNSKLELKREIEEMLTSPSLDLATLSRPNFNALLKESFTERGWESEAPVFDEPSDPGARLDFLKERVGVEVGFGHASFIGIDPLKFQVASYSGLDKIDVGVYIVTTREFQRRMMREFRQNWDGSLRFEKIVRYLPHFKSAIQVPMRVYDILCKWL
jgi:hypothetical protein